MTDLRIGKNEINGSNEVFNALQSANARIEQRTQAGGGIILDVTVSDSEEDRIFHLDREIRSRLDRMERRGIEAIHGVFLGCDAWVEQRCWEAIKSSMRACRMDGGSLSKRETQRWRLRYTDCLS